MDLTVETKQYRLSYDHLEMSYIHNFISDMIKGYAKQGETYYLKCIKLQFPHPETGKILQLSAPGKY